MKRVFAALAGASLFALAIPLIAQDNPPSEDDSLLDTIARAAQLDADSQRSGLIGFVEEQISTPDRQIRITGIDGVLSSNASIDQITVSDTQGIYLVIENARIVWNQGALLFGNLEIETLAADTIVYARNPVVTEEGPPPSPEAGGFSVPELPVSVSLDQLDVPSVRFGEEVFGLAAEVSLNGAISLDGGALDANLDIVRLDGPGGALDLDIAYANEGQAIDVDLTLTEPEDGIIANLLNIEGRPDIALSVAGDGQLTDLTTQLALDADGQRVLSGTGLVATTAEGLTINGDLGGPIADILPEVYRDFFGAETALTFQTLIADEGGIMVPSFSLTGGQLALTGSAETSQDGFLSRLEVDGEVRSGDGTPVVLPVPGAATSVEQAQLRIDYGAQGGENWTGTIEVIGYSSPEFDADTISLNGNGVAANLEDPAARRVTFNADGAARGVAASDPAVAQALGSEIGVGFAGMWQAGQPVELAQLRVMGDALALELAGEFSGTDFTGTIALDTASLAPFSGLAGRPLTGAANIMAEGDIALASAGFDLTLSGTADDPTIGEPALDALLAGQAALSGRIARTEEGLEAEDLLLENPQITLAADGTYATGAADFRFEAALADLGLVTEEASGRVTATGTATGSEGIIALNSEIALAQGTLSGRTLQDATVSFGGTTTGDGLVGALTGNAFLDGFRVALAADIEAGPERLALSGLSFEAPGASLTGNLIRDAEGLFTGALTLDAPDVETTAALALIEASGAVSADITLAPEDGAQRADLTASVTALEALDVSIASATVDLQIGDLFGVPVVQGDVNGTNIAAAGTVVETVRLAARADGVTTTFEGEAALENETDIALGGSLASVEGGFRVALDALSLEQGQIAARLQQPTALTIAGETVSFDGLALSVGSGSITISGTAGSDLDLTVDIASLPLSIANAVAPDLGVAGTLNGSAAITGPASDPAVQFSLEGSGLDAAAITDFGIAPFSFALDGRFAEGVLTLASAEALGASGLNVTASGSAPLSGPGLDLSVAGSAPLALAQQFMGGRDTSFSGTIVFEIDVTGSIDDPEIDGDIRLDEARVFDPELDLGLSGITASVSVSADQAVIRSFSGSLDGGGSINASGTVPFAGPGLNVAVNGSAPLSLANRFVADRGAQLSGTATVNASVTGSLTDPQIGGRISVAGGEYTDPGLNLRLVNISGAARLSGEQAVIEQLTADLIGGGSVSASGSVSLDAALNANISVALNQAQYSDGDLVAATVSGALNFTGPITDGSLLSGGITIERAEVAVPETFGANATLIDVTHRNPPAAVAASLARLRANLGDSGGGGGEAPIRLDVTISAPNQVFIRGRGLDAELGGSLQITGTTANIVPVGGLELIRGRLEILGQRIDFESGTLTLVGDFDPFIDLVAVTQGESITVFVSISGQVSEPQIEFGSTPMLPQDEVLARLLFDRGIGELSPIQLAQLAGVAAQLVGGGGGGPSFLDQIRQAAGLDDLDIITDESGNAAVRAGNYIDDNIYLSVDAGASGGRVSVDLELSDNLSARVSTGTDGNSSAGIFYEQDY